MAGRSSGGGGDGARVKAHILVLEARYYEQIGNALLNGAIAEMEAEGVTWDIITVPGALELPLALSQAVGAGLIPSTSGEPMRYDGAIALGCVIRGETTHYETVSNEANHWLMEVAMNAGIPFGNAILTVENEAQARERAEGGRRGKGADAVRACLSLIRHARAFEELGA
jgi:6,7-dimethyl-8-ribityllumazine synthase